MHQLLARTRARRSQLIALLFVLSIASLPAAGSADAPGAAASGARRGMVLAAEASLPLYAQHESLAPGVGASLVRYCLVPWLPLFSTDLELSYTLFPVAPGSLSNLAMGDRIDSLRLGAGLTGRLPIGRRFFLTGRASIGGAASMADFGFPPSLAWYWSGAAGVGFRLSDAIALRLETRFLDHVALAHAVSAGVGIDFSWPAAPAAGDARTPARATLASSTRDTMPVSGADPQGGKRPPPAFDIHPVALLQEGPIPELTAKVKADPARHLQSLVRALTEGALDDFARVRAIHDWIATNIAYDADAFYGKSTMITEPLAVIRHGASVCQGFSAVLQTMCGMAKIECALISGYGRGIGFDASTEAASPYGSNHAWNAVRIGELWYLIDATWDTGYVDPRTMRFGAMYETSYLFADPRAFLHTHFPSDPRWQLIEKPISYQQFCALPYLTGRFFQQGLALSEEVTLVTKVNDKMEFTVSAPEEAAVLAIATDGQGHMVPIYQEKDGGKLRFQVAFAAAGRYKVELSVGESKPGTFAQSYIGAGEFLIEASHGTTRMFPSSSGSSSFPEVVSLIELPYDPQVNEETLVPFRVPAGVLLDATLERENGATVERGAIVIDEGDRTIVRAAFPAPGDYRLRINANRTQNPLSFWDLIGSFSFHARKGTDHRFPDLFAPYLHEGWSILSPLYCPLTKGAEVSFEVSPPESNPTEPSATQPGVEVLVGGRSSPLSRGEDGRFRGTIRVDGGELTLLIKQGAQYVGLARYEVR